MNEFTVVESLIRDARELRIVAGDGLGVDLQVRLKGGWCVICFDTSYTP